MASSMIRVPFDQLSTADLVVDAIYEGGTLKNAGDDPLNKLLSCSNSGGFRYVGSLNGYSGSDENSYRDVDIKLCVLYSSLSDEEWPDSIDVETGRFVYYGDNKEPGRQLLETSKKGNVLLQYCFNLIHVGIRNFIPPFFIFTKGDKGRNVVFRGLAVPGAAEVDTTEDLVAIWKTLDGRRFQNYKSIFTILDIPQISRLWIEDLRNGNPLSKNAPINWVKWYKSQIYVPLKAAKTIEYRTAKQQLPSNQRHTEIISIIINYFKSHAEREYAFEKCAAKIAQMMDKNIVSYEMTRFWHDGGRDAIGAYRIGTSSDAIHVDFALEAKCKELHSGSGVKETSRLISRLRHRQFGIFVTTSYVNKTAYKEIKEDRHPVIIIGADDICNILINAGLKNGSAVQEWLKLNF